LKARIPNLNFQILISALLCLACVSASAQDKVRARAKGRQSVVVKERGRAFTVDLSKHIDAARIEDASALFLSRRGGFTYLVLSVCGMSKDTSDDRQCGAGIECNLVWLKLDARRRAADAKSERYESCWMPVTSDEGPKVTGRRLTLEYDDLRENLHHSVTYDADRPEDGLKSETTPLPEQNP
jgi:hypothetical protein